MKCMPPAHADLRGEVACAGYTSAPLQPVGSRQGLRKRHRLASCRYCGQQCRQRHWEQGGHGAVCPALQQLAALTAELEPPPVDDDAGAPPPVLLAAQVRLALKSPLTKCGGHLAQVCIRWLRSGPQRAPLAPRCRLA